MRRTVWTLLASAVVLAGFAVTPAQAEQQAFGQVWGHSYRATDWERFYHYPYVFYPQNYWGNEYFRSADSLLPSISAGDARSGLQQAVAQLLPPGAALSLGTPLQPRRLLTADCQS